MTNEQKTACHGLYVALFNARRIAPEMFSDAECTRVLTSVMAAKRFSWRVVGITTKALEAFKSQDFRYKSGCGVTRAHLVPRIETVRRLMKKESPLGVEGFMALWVANDRTVLCAKGENNTSVPDYIPIANEDGLLFSCEGVLAGWRHRDIERSFLRRIYAHTNHSELPPA